MYVIFLAAVFAIIMILQNIKVDSPLSSGNQIAGSSTRNMSFKEIAERTGVSINTALGRMRYALINIRRMAEEKSMSLSMS